VNLDAIVYEYFDGSMKKAEMVTFRFLSDVMASLRNVYYRFSALTVNFGTQVMYSASVFLFLLEYHSILCTFNDR